MKLKNGGSFIKMKPKVKELECTARGLLAKAEKLKMESWKQRNTHRAFWRDIVRNSFEIKILYDQIKIKASKSPNIPCPDAKMVMDAMVVHSEVKK